MKRLLLPAVLLCAGCPAKTKTDPVARDAGPDRTLVQRSRMAMGTQIAITAYTYDERGAEAAIEAAFDEFDRLEALLSVWRPNSDVSAINKAAGQNTAIPVRPDTFAVVQRAIEFGAKTEGKFDITFGALSGLWKFDHDQDDKIPSDADIAARLPHVGYERVILDPTARTIRLKDKGMRMHLGGVGKGYAVDLAVQILRARGLDSFMVQAGGDLYCAGNRGDRAWRVGVRDPRASRAEFFAFAEVTDETFSTSGDYERFFIKDGVRYHHIIDPDLGRPARGLRSVTIMAPEALTADVLSTAVFILGTTKGLALVESIPGAGAILIDDQNVVHTSKRLEGKITTIKSPTP